MNQSNEYNAEKKQYKTKWTKERLRMSVLQNAWKETDSPMLSTEFNIW